MGAISPTHPCQVFAPRKARGAWLGIGHRASEQRSSESRVVIDETACTTTLCQPTPKQAETIVLAAGGDLEGAEDRARAVVAMLADAEWPEAQGDAWMELARVLRTAGRPSEAEQASREALALYERKGDRPSVDAAMTFLDERVP